VNLVSPRRGTVPSAEEITLPPPPPAAEQETQAFQEAGGPQSPTVGQPTEGPDPELFDFLAPPQGPGELGRLGSYRVLKLLGSGGMGVVFLGEDPQLERAVALKAMLPAQAAVPSAKQRFLREARAAAAVKHDHIVTIYQVCEDRGVPFLAMELLEGEMLEERLQRVGRLPVTEVLRIGREIADGLAAAHERGLIHRDIKPANVWLEGARARVKILDFGLARALSDNTRLTVKGAILGTPAFMAPEQANGQAVDARCDLFSLGCVLYRMATGVLPFDAGDAISTLMAVATEQPRAPAELNRALPPALCNLTLHLLAKSPAERPPSARAVVEALEAIERQEQAPAVVVPVAEAEPAPVKAPTPPRKAPARPAVAAAPVPKQAARSSGAKTLLGCGGAVVATVLLVCGGLAAGVYWLVEKGFPHVADQFKQALEDQRGWDEVARFWRPPPADAGPDRLFPARVGEFSLAGKDTQAALDELNLPAAPHHALYRSGNEQIDVYVRRATRLEKEALFRRALDKVNPPKDKPGAAAPPGGPGDGQVHYHMVTGSPDSPRISYDLSPPHRHGMLWWDRDWLFVVRTGGGKSPGDFLKQYLAAISAPEPGK
jgi:hypothetical protein